MTVRVLFFATLQDITGKTETDVLLEPRTTLEQCLSQLSVTLPDLGPLLGSGRILVCVNREPASGAHLLQDGEEIALMPPFSGGAV